MKKIVRLTEKDINMLVKKIIRESDPGDGKKDDFSEYEGRTDIYADNRGFENNNDLEQNLTERELTRLVKTIIREGYEDDYTASGLDTIRDVSHSLLKSKGFSHRGKDDEGEFYIVFDGEKFYEDDFEIADHNDIGKIPRVEDGKLIIANPAWGA